MNDTSLLLRQYAGSRSDEAFKALVDQYVGLVFSACFRQLKDRHLAEDAAQAVFILLSQKAGGLSQTHLTGWLLTTSRYACANIRKSEQRRQRREQVAAMNPTIATQTPGNDLLDLLDDALCNLKSTDREALVLRYLKDQPLSEVAQTLGVSEQAARKRVDRGIEKLRAYFSRRGITTTSAALGPILTEQLRGSVLTPAACQILTQNIVHVCEAGASSTAASVAIAKGINTMMIFAKIKIAAVLLFIVAAMATTSWMISGALADNTSASQVVTQAQSARSIPAPTTMPSEIDLTTPDNAARCFFVAVKNADRAGAYACLTVDPNRPPTLMDAMLAWNFAQNHLVLAVIHAWGGDGAAVKNLVTVDEVARIFAINPNSKLAIISGDTATITTDIPPWMISMAPPNYQRVLHNWDGKNLYFQKQADGWKFDIDRSMRVTAKVYDASHRRIDRATAIAIMMQYATLTNQVALAVEAGQVNTAAAAAAAVNTGMNRVSQTYNVSNSNYDIVPGSAN